MMVVMPTSPTWACLITAWVGELDTIDVHEMWQLIT